ncbi:Relaxase/mobilization nuclease domain protein [Bacteroidales bacterium Barb6XT]|nr:Relaxase/mobilization nuclease domain protein [Bacteroidales bacterium Barb6XT]
MMAKIVKGMGFKGVVNYVLDKAKQTELLAAEGVRYKSRESIIRSLVAQASLNPKVSKPVCHISLDFSAQDKEKLSSAKMVQIAKEYMAKMEITNTQYIIGRHYDKEHPHIHIVFNRVDNDGKTITDKNDRYRSEKICKELTEKHGLYFAQGKENVKEHRLKEPDKTKYEIYNTLQSAVPKCKNWKQLANELQRNGITTNFKYNSDTNNIQGVKFEKNSYIFNGSKVDRLFSYSKIDYQLQQNNRAQEVNVHQSPQEYSQNQSSTLESAASLLGGLFDIPAAGSDFDPDQAEWLRQHKKKKKSKGFRL